ncbi:MAG: hypothetical protein ABR968_14160 [Bacteroidales bacterium]
MNSGSGKQVKMSDEAIESFLKELNSHIQKIKFKHKDKSGITIDVSTLKMISIENIEKSLEKHLGIIWTPPAHKSD